MNPTNASAILVGSVVVGLYGWTGYLVGYGNMVRALGLVFAILVGIASVGLVPILVWKGVIRQDWSFLQFRKFIEHSVTEGKGLTHAEPRRDTPHGQVDSGNGNSSGN